MEPRGGNWQNALSICIYKFSYRVLWEGVSHTLQLLHRQTKLAVPFDPEISCSSCFCRVKNNSLGDGGLKRFEEWDIYLLVQADSLGVDFST